MCQDTQSWALGSVWSCQDASEKWWGKEICETGVQIPNQTNLGPNAAAWSVQRYGTVGGQISNFQLRLVYICCYLQILDTDPIYVDQTTTVCCY